jgi:hypothetical protein
MRRELEVKFRERGLPICTAFPHNLCGIGVHPRRWLVQARLALVRADRSGRRPDPLRVEQVKEKFGCLRFYTNTCTELIQALIEAAEDESLRTCEVCGQPGAFRKDKCQAMCDRHANEAFNEGQGLHGESCA